MPATGFDPNLSTSDLTINGSAVTADVSEAISQAQLDRVLVGASTLKLTLEDPARTLTNSQIAQIIAPTPAGQGLAPFAPYKPTTVTVTDSSGETLTFAMCQIAKQGDQLQLVFEDYWINALRFVFASQPGYMTASGTITRADFMVQIINKAGLSIPTIVVPATFPGIQQIETDTGDSQWGTSSNPTEDAWTALTRLANAVQWRCFSNGNAIVIGPDEWLLSFPAAASLFENTGGVDAIDFDWDMGKALATATIAANTAVVGFAPGAPVKLNNLGVASGTWLVSDIGRSLFLPDTTIACVQPQPTLTEAQLAASVAGGTTSDTSAGAPGGSSGGTTQARQAVAFALAQVGKPYVWGGTGPGGYDCSGLVYAAYQSAGVSVPRTSQAQWASLKHIDISTLVPGDLIFYAGSDGTTSNPGHVVMYIGNQQVVEAIQTGTNIQVGAIPGGYIGAARPTGP